MGGRPFRPISPGWEIRGRESSSTRRAAAKTEDDPGFFGVTPPRCDCDEVRDAASASAERACQAGGDADCHAVDIIYGTNSVGACAVSYSCLNEVRPSSPTCLKGEHIAVAPGTSGVACGSVSFDPGAPWPPQDGQEEDDTDTLRECAIEVCARHFNKPGGGWMYHTFIRRTHLDGHQDAIHGEPDGPGCGLVLWGCLQVWPPDLRSGVTRNLPEHCLLVELSAEACDRFEVLEEVAARINDAHHYYHPLTANSNSVAYTLLVESGLPAVYPPEVVYRIPGWGTNVT